MVTSRDHSLAGSLTPAWGSSLLTLPPSPESSKYFTSTVVSSVSKHMGQGEEDTELVLSVVLTHHQIQGKCPASEPMNHAWLMEPR